MDFTGLSGFITKHTIDEISGDLTITYRDDSDTVTIGEIIIEGVRARAFFDAMCKIQEARWPNGVTRQSHKTIFEVNTDEGTTEFL